MKVRFWGVRGSLPTPISSRALEDKLVRVLQGAKDIPLDDPERVRQYLAALPVRLRGTYGGDTSCVQVTSGGDGVILDAGTGIFRLGEAWAWQDESVCPRVHHIFLTHLHWDHTVGLPFFAPLLHADNQVIIYGAHPGFEEQLLAQHSPPNFPVPLLDLRGSISFRSIAPGEPVTIGGLRIDCMELPHPGRSFAFRVEDGESAVVYATDAEYRDLSPEAVGKYVSFFQGADALIVDAQYDVQEGLGEKRDWGHSSPLAGARLCVAANVGLLVLFHHDPSSSDDEIADMEARIQTFLDQHVSSSCCRAVAAHEDLEICL